MTFRRLAMVVAGVGFAPQPALACPVCCGASDGPLLQGSNMGIVALLIVTLVMLGAFGLFFVHLMRRSAAVAAATAAPPASVQESGPR